jgi:hypothetical protein
MKKGEDGVAAVAWRELMGVAASSVFYRRDT